MMALAERRLDKAGLAALLERMARRMPVDDQ